MMASAVPALQGCAARVQPTLRQRWHRHRQSVAAPPAARKQREAGSSKGFGKGAPAAPADLARQQPESPPAEAVGSPEVPPQPAGGPDAGSTSSSASLAAGALPAVGRARVLAVCTQVSVLVAAFGVGLRQLAPAVSPAVGDGRGDTVEALLNWAVLPSPGQLALAVAVAAGVTAARTALLASWPEFREAADRSNQQVLAPLQPLDLLVVGGLPAVSEELLFRGALIPAVYPDWRGVLIAGLAFGVLHNSGGRNPAFAAWASAVGCAYGALFLATGSVACPALAHVLSNVAAGALWKAQHAAAGRD